GDTRSASMENLADDAVAGVQLLSRRADIDASKIGVMGHSQGGWIAPLAASRSKQVGFVIVSAAAAVTPAEQSIYHRAGVMRSQGVSDAEIEQASKLRQRLYDLNKLILADEPFQKERASISQELMANKDARWFAPAELPPQLAGDLPPRGALELLFFDPTGVWKKVRVPVLAIWGDKDTVVPVDKSRAIIERLQHETGNKRLTVVVVQGVDHGTNVVKKDAAWDFPRTSHEYLRTIVEWAQKTVI
ncbi:MAG TPA: alpha/beta hydrolase, partial [Pyrinomonadaceae bacterium]|nr:alpha/beta hydrolase [Pyrinomonadaceae bacterium]